MRQYSGIKWRLKWSSRPFASYYLHLVEPSAQKDPRATVGGLWEVLGPLQLEFLRGEGLQPHHELLDLGCGCLRGGLHFIRYLEPGNYWGADISLELLQAGKRFLSEESLEARSPHLLSVSPGLTFEELGGKKFDYVLAFGIFPDMPIEYVRECFANLHRVLKPNGRFYATFIEGPQMASQRRAMRFQYPVELLRSLAEAHGYKATVSTDFHHPRGHSMLQVTYKLAPVKT
jgi:cyclopropane fatty-acyl-phospholipid synthase-like methyltransferase